jgi:hypothetical protein
MVSDKRRGAKRSEVSLEVIADKELIDNVSRIFKCDFVFYFGDDFAKTETLYCGLQHDLGIEMAISDLGLKNKRIKKIEIKKLYDVGGSIAKHLPIEKWKITNEQTSKN